MKTTGVKTTGVPTIGVNASEHANANQLPELIPHSCQPPMRLMPTFMGKSYTEHEAQMHVVTVHEGEDDDDQDDHDDHIPQHKVLATPQMSMNKGLKVFGQDGIELLFVEMKQLHNCVTMKPKHSKDLTSEQHQEALAYLMFLKRKRCGKIKARGCADGQKQRTYMDKEAATSPTVSTEAVFLTAVIDALEGCNVTTVDVPGAFMQADMDEFVHVRFTGKMVDLFLDIDTKTYGPYVTDEGKECAMYVELLKALYGTLHAVQRFWEKLSGQLQEWGYVTNPHDPCVVNKDINGKQCTVAWHVNELKISHADSCVVDDLIVQMNDKF